jgi:hypothetical protein
MAASVSGEELSMDFPSTSSTIINNDGVRTDQTSLHPFPKFVRVDGGVGLRLSFKRISCRQGSFQLRAGQVLSQR